MARWGEGRANGTVAKDLLRILHVGKYYPPYVGGTEIYTRDLVQWQVKSASVTVIVSNDTTATSYESVNEARVIRVPRFGVIASMPVTPTLPVHIRRVPADIVHLHMPNPAAALSYLLSGHRGQLILTHHADTVGRRFLRSITDPIVKEVMARACRIIVTTKSYLDTSGELADYADKCRVIPLGVDPGTFASVPEDEVQAIRSKYGTRLLLCIGRLVEYKGFEFAIRALGSLEARLLIVGNGRLQSHLHQVARDCGVADRVHFLGSLPNERIPALLKAATILLFPSTRRTESFGYVQLEAMASGLPVINTAIKSGASEVSLDGITGFTVPAKDSEALAAAAQKLLHDTNLRQRFGEAGIRRVNEYYTLDRMCKLTSDLYQEVLDDRLNLREPYTLSYSQG